MNTGDQVEETIPITMEEEKQLRRVFDLLCDYHIKRRIEEDINTIRCLYKLKPMFVTDMIASLATWRTAFSTSSLPEEEMRRLEGLYKELEDVRKTTSELIPGSSSEGNNMMIGKKLISVSDVVTMMKTLHLKISRREVEEMMWEVDEDLDGMLSWTEFRLMFTRNIMDKTGLEPSRMFNLVQFLIYDAGANGKVSLDETMHMLYTRYGKRELETKLREIFGPQANSSGLESGDITFAAYLRAVEKVQMQMFWKSAKGQVSSLKHTSRDM